MSELVCGVYGLDREDSVRMTSALEAGGTHGEKVVMIYGGVPNTAYTLLIIFRQRVLDDIVQRKISNGQLGSVHMVSQCITADGPCCAVAWHGGVEFHGGMVYFVAFMWPV